MCVGVSTILAAVRLFHDAAGIIQSEANPVVIFFPCFSWAAPSSGFPAFAFVLAVRHADPVLSAVEHRFVFLARE